MIPGSISKISEGIVPCADVIKAQNDLVRVTGAGTINTINPGLGTAQGQFLMIVPLDNPIVLGTQGNILGGMTIPRYHVVTLVFSKPLQKWLLPAAIGVEEDEDMAETIYIPYVAADFTADGGTWTVSPNTLYGIFYYIHAKRVTLSLTIGASIINPNTTIKTIRMRLPQAVSQVALQGPYSQFPTNPSGFVGNSFVATDLNALNTTAIPTFCGVGHLPSSAPWPNLSITCTTGNFPTTPAAGFVILASATYIIQ